MGKEGYVYDGPKYFGLSGTKLSTMIGVAAGSGFLLFGYDQGVMGGLLTLNSFVREFPEINTTGKEGTSQESTLQGLTIGLYEIGCFLGALSCLWLGDMLGRRAIIWIGTVFMIMGAAIQAGSVNLGMLIFGRIWGGIGNGMHTATIPMWQSECSPPHKRGYLVMIEGALITGGICMAYWVDFAFFWLDPEASGSNAPLSTSSASWRVPIAFQIILCIPTLITIWMPESPRWLLLKGRETEARQVMACLNETSLDDPEIELNVRDIKQSIAEAQRVGVSDLFKQGKERNFHRTALGFVIQMFQQISGINLITYYAATIFEQNIGMSALISRIVAAANGTEYFLASFIAVYTIEKFGRRKLMLFGAVGMSACMLVLTITTADGVTKPIEVNGRREASNAAPGYVAAVMLFLFNSFFAIGWLGMTWLYPAEITPLSIRAAANGVSTCANWLFNFMVVLITPIAFANIKNYTYLIFCIINALMVVATWWIFPETAGRSLEEMDAIFAKSSYWNPHDVVVNERKTPRKYDVNGRLIGDIESDLFGESEKRDGTHVATNDAASSGSSRQ